VWDSAGPDGRRRDAHAKMDGQKRGHNEPFLSPDGSRLRWPGDSGLGASAANTVNCRCYVRDEIDFVAKPETQSIDEIDFFDGVD